MESIDEGDFVIRVRPTEVDGEWTGEVIYLSSLKRTTRLTTKAIRNSCISVR